MAEPATIPIYGGGIRTLALACTLACGILTSAALGCSLTAIVGEPFPHRLEILDVAAKTKSPVFLKQTDNGEIPVALINGATADNFRDFFVTSFGTSVRYQRSRLDFGVNYDHGGTRVGSSLSEFDGPVVAFFMKDGKPDLGPRELSQVNRSGVVRLDVFANIAFRENGGKRPRIEVAYKLTPKELEVARFYHQVRRAGLIRVPFRRVNWSEDGSFTPVNSPLRNANDLRALPEACEMCFDFAKGTRLDVIQSAIEKRLEDARYFGLGYTPYDKHPVLVSVLSKAREKLLAAESESPERQIELLDGPTLENLGLGRAINKALKETWFGPSLRGRKIDPYLVSLMLAHQSIVEYRKLLETLGVTPDVGYEDMNNPRATAVLVYDSKKASISRFRKATWESDEGVFTQWTTEGQRPIPRGK